MGIWEKCSRCSEFQNAYQNTSPETNQQGEVDVRNSSHNKNELFGNPSASQEGTFVRTYLRIYSEKWLFSSSFFLFDAQPQFAIRINCNGAVAAVELSQYGSAVLDKLINWYKPSATLQSVKIHSRNYSRIKCEEWFISVYVVFAIHISLHFEQITNRPDAVWLCRLLRSLWNRNGRPRHIEVVWNSLVECFSPAI